MPSSALNPTLRRQGEDGFTLLELLAVIVVLGLLIGLVAPAVLRRLSHAKESIAKQSIARIVSVLDLYSLMLEAIQQLKMGYSLYSRNQTVLTIGAVLI